MKRGQILGILALLLICAIAVIPAMGANVTTSYPQAPDAATNYYNSAVQLTTSGDNAAASGDNATASKSYLEAIALYDMALNSNTTEIQESDGLLYTYQGKSYAQIQLGNYTGAIDTLNAGLALYPTDEHLWNNKGYAQFKTGDYKDAVTSYNNALANDSNNTLTLVNKGDALVKLGNYQDAVTSYKAALANNPDSNETATKLAAAEKFTSAELPVSLIALVIVVIIAGAGVAYYILKKRPVQQKANEVPVKKAGSKKNKK
ncbi:tetratricopeptide repeat protein [Methanoregula boonei]|nr:tetratricopeptide repeat protein [Methanoregula boonei]